PDVLAASSFLQEALLIVKQSKQLRFCPKMLALTVGPEIPDFAASLGKDANYIYGSTWWLPNMGWKGRDFGSSRDYAKAMVRRTGVITRRRARPPACSCRWRSNRPTRWTPTRCGPRSARWTSRLSGALPPGMTRGRTSRAPRGQSRYKTARS